MQQPQKTDSWSGTVVVRETQSIQDICNDLSLCINKMVSRLPQWTVSSNQWAAQPIKYFHYMKMKFDQYK